MLNLCPPPDRPDLFAAYVHFLPFLVSATLTLLWSINDPDDQFQRMLAVIRFTFSKELKFVVRVLPYWTFIALILTVWSRKAKSASPTIAC